jgi:hypothetical protein
VVEIIKLVEYVDSKEDPLIQIVRTHHHNINSTILRAARHLKTELQGKTGEIKVSVAEITKERWRGRRMHEHFPRNLEEKQVDNEATSMAPIWRH